MRILPGATSKAILLERQVRELAGYHLPGKLSGDFFLQERGEKNSLSTTQRHDHEAKG